MQYEDARNRLHQQYEKAVALYYENGKTDYDAGIAEGLKRALETLEALRSS